MGKNKNCLLMFRLPATDEGFDLVKQMRKALNKDSYKMRTLYTGKRPHGHTPYTLKKDAESIRVYIDSKMPVSKPSDEEARSLYMEGFNKGKAKSKEWSPYHTEVRKQLREREDEVEQLKKEVEEQAKRIDNSPSYNRLKVENRVLKLEIDRLNARVEEIEHSDCESIDACNCTCKMCEQVEGTLIKEKAYLETKMEGMRREIIALNKSLATANGDIVTYTKLLSKEIDMNNKVEKRTIQVVDGKAEPFEEWQKKQAWYQRFVYKVASLTNRDLAIILLATWTIPTTIFLLFNIS